MIRLLLVVIPLACLVVAAGRAEASECAPLDLDATLARIVPEMHSYTLPNGLRVHLVPRAGEATLSLRVAYDVGARDEPEGRSGTAHLFEHMMFKGSARIPDGGHFRLVRDTGGGTNAMTDYDSTEYWNTLPSDGLGRVLFAEADRMQSLRITPANLDNQRAAIEEEGLGLANLPYVSAAAEFGLALWAGTPYGHSPIGTEADLAALTQAEALAFHAEYYAPSNAVLVIVGGFEVASARALIEETFGRLAAGAPRPAREVFEVDRRARAEVIEDPLAPFPVYAVVWHSVGARSDEALALRVIDRLLLGHSNARFARSIRGPLALDAYSVSLAFRDVGLLNYVFAPRTFASFDEIETVVRREISSLREQGPTPQELCESVRREQFERLAAIDSHEGVAAAIARGALLEENPLRFAEELWALDALDREAIRRAATSFLVDDFLTLEIQPTGFMRWLKPVLEFLPSSVGAGLEGLLL